MENKLQLSHVLYKVDDLHGAVKKLKDAGFILEYGTKPEKAYNALIWFEEGVFIEIYNNSRLPALVKWFMKTFGYKPILDRMNKWEQVEKGWCEWSLESNDDNLNAQKSLFKEKNIPFKFHKVKRKDIHQQILRWELLMPNDIIFPFIMSDYVPNPRPKQIQHPNGVTRVTHMLVGKEKLNVDILNTLLHDETNLKLIESKVGLQDVVLNKVEIKINEILK